MHNVLIQHQPPISFRFVPSLILSYLQTTALPCGYDSYQLLIMSLRLKELLSFPQECALLFASIWKHLPDRWVIFPSGQGSTGQKGMHRACEELLCRRWIVAKFEVQVLGKIFTFHVNLQDIIVIMQ